MDIAEIFTDVKTRGGIDEDDDVLLRWANQVYSRVNRKISETNPTYFYTTDDIDVAVGDSNQLLPATFSKSLKIEDSSGNRVDRVNPLDANKPAGWFFLGQTIVDGVRYERIRAQGVNAADTWTIFFVEQPAPLDLEENNILQWPVGFDELMIVELLLIAMETEEEDERYKQYLNRRNELTKDLVDLISSRNIGDNDEVLVTSEEEFD